MATAAHAAQMGPADAGRIGPWPLMVDNITRDDLDAVVRFLSGEAPILTQSVNVAAFEREWAEWLGVRHCLFVNSGSSANQMTIAALRERGGAGEIIVPTLTWVSDIAAVLQAGMTPVFVDIDPSTLGMDLAQVLDRITPRTKGVFLTHILGYDALTDEFLSALRGTGVPLIEDVCESHGATHAGKRVGTFGMVSNFSFYYAHHLSTIEGGMVCTDDTELYHMLRMMRSHGMVRESQSDVVKDEYRRLHPDLNPDFIFAFPAYNFRSTEINAVIGRSQLPRLDGNNARRTENLHAFLDGLDPARYRTDFKREGSSNYAFTLVLREPDEVLRDRVERVLREHAVEFRRGTSGGGNQLRQPYLRRLFGEEYRRYPQVDHVHFFGWYIGNYPSLDVRRVRSLCTLLNGL